MRSIQTAITLQVGCLDDDDDDDLLHEYIIILEAFNIIIRNVLKLKSTPLCFII